MKKATQYILLLLTMVCLSAPAWGQTDSSGYTPMGSGYTPSSITTTVEYDAESGTYVKVTRLGEMVLGKEYMTFDHSAMFDEVYDF